MKQVVVYCRISPRPKENESIDTQARACREWVDAQDDCELVAEYSDSMKTGSNMKRDGVRQALQHVRELGPNGILCVYTLSRLSRDAINTLQIVKQLGQAGCRIYLVLKDAYVKSDTPDEWFVFGILALNDERERWQTSITTSDHMRRQQAAGKRVGGDLRYGLMLDPEHEDQQHVCDNSHEIRVIGLIRRMRIRSWGYSRIARRLNSMNIPCRGSAWHHQTVRRILDRVDG